MAIRGSTGLRRIFNAFIFSLHGMRACFVKEEAFRQEVWMAVILIPVALYLGETTMERIVLIASLWLVLMVEILNSAIERVVDRISFERHELSKEAKDMGSAAVFLSIVLAITVWGFIVIDKAF